MICFCIPFNHVEPHVMNEIINLNKRRKAASASQKSKQAEVNRQKFGRTKQEKQLEKLKAEKLERHLKGHEREPE